MYSNSNLEHDFGRVRFMGGNTITMSNYYKITIKYYK